MNTDIKAIVFDLGGVLIDWNPEYLFKKIFDDPAEMKHFLTNVCTSDWNEEQDAGRSLEEGTNKLIKQHPEFAGAIKAYYGRWPEMLGGMFDETVQVLRRLKEEQRYRLYALTNWSAETFPIAQQRYGFLHWFDGIVVSGIEKIRKPSTSFYQLLLERYCLKANEVIFIDDNLRNIEAAEQLGINVIHYSTGAELLNTLLAWKILG